MDNLQKQLDNLDQIQEQIKKNNNLNKYTDSKDLNSIIKLVPEEKNELEKKISTIKRFTEQMDYIYKNKPETSNLNSNLVEYLGYTKSL
jgi:hypothetical protein